jgi:hypothetical protein
MPTKYGVRLVLLPYLSIEEDCGQVVVLVACRAGKVDKIAAVGVVHTWARL